MRDLPLISIVVPVYQVSAFIVPCLQSIVDQDYQGRMECILVDDCGKDDSFEKAKCFIDNYAGAISFVLLKHSSNRGLSAARNTGISASSGEYVFLLDSDDTIPSDAIRCLTEPLTQQHYDVVSGRYQEVGLSSRISVSMPNGSLLKGDEILSQYAQDKWPVTAWNKLYRKAYLLSAELLFSEGIIYEDSLWSFEVACSAQSLYIVDHITYLYTIREGSIITASGLKRRIDSLSYVLDKIQSIANANDKSRDYYVYNKIERLRMGLFRLLRSHKKDMKRVYQAQREAKHLTWLDRLRINGSHMKFQLRDFHWALPKSMGAVYVLNWLRIEQKVKGY